MAVGVRTACAGGALVGALAVWLLLGGAQPQPWEQDAPRAHSEAEVIVIRQANVVYARIL